MIWTAAENEGQRSRETKGATQLTANGDGISDILNANIAFAVTEDIGEAGRIEGLALSVVELRVLLALLRDVGRCAGRVDPEVGRAGIEDERQGLRGGSDRDVDAVLRAQSVVGDWCLELPATKTREARDGVDTGPDETVTPRDDGARSLRLHRRDRWRQERQGQSEWQHAVVRWANQYKENNQSK